MHRIPSQINKLKSGNGGPVGVGQNNNMNSYVATARPRSGNAYVGTIVFLTGLICAVIWPADSIAQGARMGGFMVAANSTLAAQYTDNVFLAETDKVEDFKATLTTGITARALTTRHSFETGGQVKLIGFADSDDDNAVNTSARMAGRLDVARWWNLTTALRYEFLTEARGGLNDENGSSPTEYDKFNIAVASNWSFNFTRLSLRGTFNNADYDDTPAVGPSGPFVINNDDRDRSDTQIRLQIGQTLSPALGLYGRYTYTLQDYDSAVDDNGFNRDSDSIRAGIGINIDQGDLLAGSIGLTYTQRNSDDSRLNEIEAFGAVGSVRWSPNRLTIIDINVATDINETTTASTGGYISYAADFIASRSISRRSEVGGHIKLNTRDYDQIGRNDFGYKLGLGYRLNVNRYLAWNIRGEHGARQSNFAGLDFKQNLIETSITLKN